MEPSRAIQQKATTIAWAGFGLALYGAIVGFGFFSDNSATNLIFFYVLYGPFVFMPAILGLLVLQTRKNPVGAVLMSMHAVVYYICYAVVWTGLVLFLIDPFFRDLGQVIIFILTVMHYFLGLPTLLIIFILNSLVVWGTRKSF